MIERVGIVTGLYTISSYRYVEIVNVENIRRNMTCLFNNKLSGLGLKFLSITDLIEITVKIP